MTTYPLNSFFVYLKGALLVTFTVAILALTVSTTFAANHQATVYKTANIEGLDIFYREPGKKDAPTILLLHGLPTSSRMYS